MIMTDRQSYFARHFRLFSLLQPRPQGLLSYWDGDEKGTRLSLLEGKYYLQNLVSSGRLTTWFLAFAQYSSYYLVYALIATQFNERYCEVCNESSSLTLLAKAFRERPN